METKRTLLGLGVQKQRLIKRSQPKKKKKKKKGLWTYLKSDSYMYAPLISRSSLTVHRFPQTSPVPSDTGVKATEGSEENERRLMRKFGEYMKSDSHMYAPFVDGGDDTDTASGPMSQIHRGTVAFSTMKRLIEANRLTKGSVNLLVKSHLSEENLPGISRGGHSFTQQETVKHMLYQKCCSSTVPAGKQRLGTEFRKVVVD